MAPSTISSNPIMRAVLVWSAVVCGAILIGAAVIGFLVAGQPGMWSGAVGGLIGFAFPALTAGSILFANRWFGTPNYLVIFFGVFMSVFVVKMIVFIVALNLVFGLDWVHRYVLFGALVATAVASLVVDVVVVAKTRLPAVSDIDLPGDDETADH